MPFPRFPLLTPERLDKLAGLLGIKRIGKSLGCGAYGCAFDAGDRVVKVTVDEGEAITWERLRILQGKLQALGYEDRPLEAIPEIYKVVALAVAPGRAAGPQKLYAILREKVEPYRIDDEGLKAELEVALWEYEYGFGYEDLSTYAAAIGELGPEFRALAQTLIDLAYIDLSPRDLHLNNLGMRDGQVVLFDPGDIYSQEATPSLGKRYELNPETTMRTNPTLQAGAIRVSQPEYWSVIVRAALPRTAAMARGALAELEQLDTLDVLKWSDDLGGAGPGAFDFGDWRKSLSFLAGSAAGLDLQTVERIGHVPSSAPPPTYEVTEEQYWDEVRRVLAYAMKGLAQFTSSDPDDVNAELPRELWFKIHGHNQAGPHPFTSWPRALDVLRHTQNLDAALAQPAGRGTAIDYVRQNVTYEWLQLGAAAARRECIELLAQLAMWADAVRMGTSAGRYTPNQEEEDRDYWGGDYWIVDIGGDAFDQPTREDAIEAARAMMREESVSRGGEFHKAEAVFVHRGGMGGDEPAFLTWLDLDSGEPRVVETTDPEVMVLVADRLGLRELGMPIPTAWPPGMTPNIRPDVYWDKIRQMSVRMHYPADYDKDLRLAEAFVVDYRDALDAMRLSDEPGMIGPWLPHVKAPKPFDTPLYGVLPGEVNSRNFSVNELVLAAGRVAAVGDADFWGAQRRRATPNAPPLMSLDEYLDYVRQAAVMVARSARPGATFEALLDAEHTAYAGGGVAVSAHPLIAVTHQHFPYRALDVLVHTAHPEALWEDSRRRARFEQQVTVPLVHDRTKDMFNQACMASDSEKSFAWLASAAFGADILDELAVMGLSKYAPGEVG